MWIGLSQYQAIFFSISFSIHTKSSNQTCQAQKGNLMDETMPQDRKLLTGYQSSPDPLGRQYIKIWPAKNKCYQIALLYSCFSPEILPLITIPCQILLADASNTTTFAKSILHQNWWPTLNSAWLQAPSAMRVPVGQDRNVRGCIHAMSTLRKSISAHKYEMCELACLRPTSLDGFIRCRPFCASKCDSSAQSLYPTFVQIDMVQPEDFDGLGWTSQGYDSESGPAALKQFGKIPVSRNWDMTLIDGRSPGKLWWPIQP